MTKQKLQIINLRYINLEDILGICFIAIEHDLKETKTPVQRLANTVASIIAYYQELIHRTTTNSINQYSLGLVKDIVGQLVHIKQGKKNCQIVQSSLDFNYGILRDIFKMIQEGQNHQFIYLETNLKKKKSNYKDMTKWFNMLLDRVQQDHSEFSTS